MREVDELGVQPQHVKRRLKHPGRFVVVLLTIIVCLWMIYNFIIAVSTGQKFSILGNGFTPIRNIVIAGVDEGGYRTDLILLCQINRRSGEINILQIPRDTKVQNNRNDKKINSAYYSGFDVLSDEIEQVTGIMPDNYIIMGFDGFTDIIDALGGVTVDVPMRMNYTDPVQDLVIDLKPGKQKLDGEEAQMFMRFRQNNDGTGYVNGDVDRLEAQKLLYDAVYKKITSFSGILKIPTVFSAIKSNAETNMSGSEIFGIMRDVAAIGKKNIYFHSLPGAGKYIGGGSYFVYDKDETKVLINEHYAVE